MKTDTHSADQAIAQVQSIISMVRALNRETAAEDYVAGLPADEVQSLAGELSLIEPEDTNPPLDALRERILAGLLDESIDDDDAGFQFNADTAREAIQEDAGEVTMRSNWVSSVAEMEPAEFQILLCTGGPAVRIRGELHRGEPSRAWVEHQDWGTPWTELVAPPIEQDTLLTYCQQFYFGQ
jgi:hypothetical protein